jgi:rubredoxin
MLYCPNCSEQVSMGDRFCRGCGFALSPRYSSDRLGTPISANSSAINVKRTCPVCKHSGGRDPRGFGFSNCPVCNDRRFNLIPQNMPSCRNCGGTGIIWQGGLNILGSMDHVCEICGGTGYSWNL